MPKWQHSNLFSSAEFEMRAYADSRACAARQRWRFAAAIAAIPIPSGEEDLVCLRCWPAWLGGVVPVLRFRCMAGFKPDRDLLRRDCPSRQVGNDGAGGDDQSGIEFGSGEIPGLRFGLERLRQAGASSLHRGATSGYFKSDIPSVISSLIPEHRPVLFTMTSTGRRTLPLP